MKSILTIILSLLICYTTHAQDKNDEYAKIIPEDIAAIDSIRAYYRIHNPQMLVYQPGGFDQICISSVLFIKHNEKVEYWVILFGNSEIETDSPPYYSYKVKYGGELDNSLIFSYPSYLNTGITKSEFEDEKTNFPIPNRIEDRVFYFDSDILFSFSDVSNVVSRKKYRQEWLRLIKADLVPIFKKYCAEQWSYFQGRLEY